VEYRLIRKSVYSHNNFVRVCVGVCVCGCVWVCVCVCGCVWVWVCVGVGVGGQYIQGLLVT